MRIFRASLLVLVAHCGTQEDGEDAADGGCLGEENPCGGCAALTDLGDSCTEGLGACEATGTVVCDENDPNRTVCDAIPGEETTEICDAVDNDCDGQTDEDLGLGEACMSGVGACQRSGTVVCQADGTAACDAVPGDEETEVCDGIDNDCDEETDEDFLTLGDACSDGVGACFAAGTIVCLSDGTAGCNAIVGESVTEVCDAIDNDCDESTDEGCDDDGDGFCNEAMEVGLGAPCTEGDCNDADSNANPGGTEVCATSYDDDCDGDSRELDTPDCVYFFYDGDGDLFGDSAVSGQCRCASDPPYAAATAGDCDDSDPDVRPLGQEVCEPSDPQVDNSCDGETNGVDLPGCMPFYWDSDGDGYGSVPVGIPASLCLCTAMDLYTAEHAADCNDGDNTIHPPDIGAEAPTLCELADNDCDGITDEGCVCQEGESYTCYDGPVGTAFVGRCQPGSALCTGGVLGPCVGQVLPETSEVRDLTVQSGDAISTDDDCDGEYDPTEADELLPATFYLSPTGDDTTLLATRLADPENHPFQTLTTAAKHLISGDTLVFRAGTYREMVHYPTLFTFQEFPKTTFKAYVDPATSVRETVILAFPLTRPEVYPDCGECTRLPGNYEVYCPSSKPYVDLGDCTDVAGQTLCRRPSSVEPLCLANGATDEFPFCGFQDLLGINGPLRIEGIEMHGLRTTSVDPGTGALIIGEQTVDWLCPDMRNVASSIEVHAELELAQVTIRDMLGSGLVVGGWPATIDSSSFINNGSGGFEHGIYIAGDDVVITNNVVSGSSGYGLQFHYWTDYNVVYRNLLYDNQACGMVLIGLGNAVYNNTFAYNRLCGFWVSAETNPGTTVPDNIFLNNIVAFNYDNTGYGYQIDTGPDSADDYDANLCYSNVTGYPDWSGYPTVDGVRCEIVSDPQFTDGPGRNLHVATSSPAIDAGEDLPAAYQGGIPSGDVDIGAYEMTDL